jgi:hypothetical protein
MNKTELMREFEAAVDAALHQRMYGKIEIEFKAGYATFLRTTQEKKLDKAENRYGQSNYQR